MSAPLVCVGDLATQVRGVTYGKADASKDPRPGSLPVLRAGNITDDGLTFDDLVYVPAEKISKKQMIRRHDVVIAASSGSLNVVGKAAAAPADFEGGFGAFCKVLRPSPKIDPDYFAQFFKTPDYRRRISALAAGANINNLRSEHLDEMQIPLPPLPEQRRIAEVLDRADALRSKRRAALAQLDSFTQSIFFHMFGDSEYAATNEVLLGGAVEYVTVGHVGPTSQFFCDASLGVPFLRTGNIGKLEIVTNDLKFITPSFHKKLRKSALQTGDVLVSRVISDEVRCAVVPKWLNGANCANAIVIRPGKNFAAEYLAHLIRLPKSQSAFLSRQVGSAQSVVNTKVIRDWNVVVPPIELQNAFAHRTIAIQNLKTTHRAALTELDALFASLQHRAFRGEL